MLRLSDVEAKLLSDLLSARFGLVYDEARRPFLEARLMGRLKDLHLISFGEYYRYLALHPKREQELEILKSTITNNETYFFRESYQFDILVRHVVPTLGPLLTERPLRVLCAGCSSGEEAYSIGIALQTAGLELIGREWEIDACDLNPARIAQAREGKYTANSLRACDEAQKQRYFLAQDDCFMVKPRFRKGVRFFEANLAEDKTGLRWGPYDAVFCRNVLIYFSSVAFHSAVSLFFRALAPHGYLFLGHSESLVSVRDDFVPESIDGAIVYRKARAGE